jgi:hypothetical protein
MSRPEETSQDKHIRRIRPIHELLPVAQLIATNLEGTLSNEGVDLKAYLKLMTRPHIPLLWYALHHFSGRFFETFVWLEKREIVATLSARRYSFSDRSTWLLCDFAISRSQLARTRLPTVFRSLLRRCIDHCRFNGAKEVVGDIPSGNDFLNKFAVAEGFSPIEEYSYFNFTLPRTEVKAKLLDSATKMHFGEDRPAALLLWVHKIVAALFGFQIRNFLGEIDRAEIARIEMISHPGLSSLYRIRIIPFLYLDTSLARSILTDVTQLVPESEESVILVVPRSSVELVSMLEDLRVPEVSRRRRLAFQVHK